MTILRWHLSLSALSGIGKIIQNLGIGQREGGRSSQGHTGVSLNRPTQGSHTDPG